MSSNHRTYTAKQIHEELEFKLDRIRQETMAFHIRQTTRAIEIWQTAMKQLEKTTRDQEKEPDILDHDKNITCAIKAGEYFVAGLYKSMVAISGVGHSEPSDIRLIWTGSKVELIELGYGLHHSKLVNGGRCQLSQIMQLLEKSFHIDLGNYTKVLQEIISRKSGSSKVAEKLKDGLLSYINELLG